MRNLCKAPGEGKVVERSANDCGSKHTRGVCVCSVCAVVIIMSGEEEQVAGQDGMEMR